MNFILVCVPVLCVIAQIAHGVFLPANFVKLLGNVRSHDISKTTSKCEAWPTQANFEPKRFFNGKLWYVAASYFDTGAVCTTQNLTWDDAYSGTGYGQQIQKFASGSQTNLSFELDRNALQAASFYYPYTVKTFLIVDTDYDNYAIVADCAEDWLPQPQAVSIYSRKPTMPDNYADLKSKLVKLQYDINRLIVWSVSGCVSLL